MQSHFRTHTLVILIFAAFAPQLTRAEVTITINRNDTDSAVPGFIFEKVPAAARNDAANNVVVQVVDGSVDRNSGGAGVLTDGKLPSDEDSPRANFFFGQGSDGGRLVMDLGKVTSIKAVNTYSWHAGTRGPQVYSLYAADGKAAGFDEAPKRPVLPETCGWKSIGKVDTRPRQGGVGGQYGVTVSNPGGDLGTWRYLLFDVAVVERDDPFGNTFFSEIDVLDAASTEPLERIAAQGKPEVFQVPGGLYQVCLDVADTPDLSDWAHKEIIPMVQEWYPRLIALFPSENYKAPARVTIRISPSIGGVAATSGSRIGCAAQWFRQNLQGEAKGAVFHELVHVVQQYGRNRGRSPAPGWLTEGIADYVRWFRFEPQSRGAEITARNLSRAKYDASYRITANFLNWTATKYNQDLVPKLNTAIRQGQYEPALWNTLTGFSVEDLGAQWRTAMEKKVGGEPERASAGAK